MLTQCRDFLFVVAAAVAAAAATASVVVVVVCMFLLMFYSFVGLFVFFFRSVTQNEFIIRNNLTTPCGRCSSVHHIPSKIGTILSTSVCI